MRFSRPGSPAGSQPGRRPPVFVAPSGSWALLEQSHHHRNGLLSCGKNLAKIILRLLQFRFLFFARFPQLRELGLDFFRRCLGLDGFLQSFGIGIGRPIESAGSTSSARSTGSTAKAGSALTAWRAITTGTRIA